MRRRREFPSRFLLHTLVGGGRCKMYAPTQQRNLSCLRTLLEGRDFFREDCIPNALRQSLNVVVCRSHLSFYIELQGPPFFVQHSALRVEFPCLIHITRMRGAAALHDFLALQ